MTQERAAELLGLSTRSLTDYETGQRVPANDVVDQMITVYNSQLLAVQHIRETAQFARALLPDVRAMSLPEAVLTLVDAVYAKTEDSAAVRERLAAAAGEGGAPVFVPLVEAPGEGDWCQAAG